MPYRLTVNAAQSLSVSNRTQLIQELDLLRAELDDMRAKYASLLAKLDSDAGVTDTNYGSLLALTAAKFTSV